MDPPRHNPVTDPYRAQRDKLLKKKFELNLDALLVIALLFVVALGMNFTQYRIYDELAAENRKLQMEGLVDKLNLESMQKRIDQLNGERD